MQTQPRRPIDPHRDLIAGGAGAVQAGLLGTFDHPPAPDIPARLATQAAELHEVRAELERLRAERDRLLRQQGQIAELLRSQNPDKLVHDLRNLLNEVQLYKMLAETLEK
jgi:signal transduction histidine kinase